MRPGDLQKRKSQQFMINNRYYERKGQLFKRSMNNNNFKPRQFVLQGERLYYYKKDKGKDGEQYFNLISLKNARIVILNKPPAHVLKLNQMYKNCF